MKSLTLFCCFTFALVGLIGGAPSPRVSRPTDPEAYLKFLGTARDVLDRVPLIDGHNDFPMTLRDYAKNQVASLDINDLTSLEPWASSPLSHTDIKRLRQGKMGAQVIAFKSTVSVA